MPNTIEVDALFGRIEAFSDDLITDQIVSFGAHTRPELAFFLSVVEAGDAVFDIGGHIGTFAIPIAQKVGTAGRVLVVEGSLANFGVLSRNVSRLALSQIVYPIYAVIGLSTERYTLQSVNRNTGASFFLPTQDSDGTVAACLDDLLQAHFVPRVVKMDIEGLEVAALQEASKLLVSLPILYLEVSDQQLRRCDASLAELSNMLVALGYRFFRNVGDRNGAHDDYVVRELADLSLGGTFFDVLAVHSNDPRIQGVIAEATLGT